MATDLTVGDAIRNYISAMKPEDRPMGAPVLQNFSRWFGGERSIKEIDPVQLERFQDQMTASGQDPANKLEPLRQFLSDARAKKLIDVALASHVKIRRKTALERLSLGKPVEIATIDMTRAGHDQLQAELVRLEVDELPSAISEMARAAADKDFRENAPYDAAKQHRAEIQRKIDEIKETLSRAAIVEQAGVDRATVGNVVMVRDLDEDEVYTYTLVGPGERGPNKISVHSPVGKALVDHVVGDVVAVTVPAGVHHYRVERIGR